MYLPKVSILMNCFNGEKYISEAINSVLFQTYEIWELIIWDNQSNDNSKNIIFSYNDNRIQYYYAANHTCLGKARQLASLKFTGELIAFLDVDDKWMERKLEKQVNKFKNKDVASAIQILFGLMRKQIKFYTGINIAIYQLQIH